jgi:hypothetical protein
MRTVQERLKKQTEDKVEQHLLAWVKRLRGICIKLPAIWYAGIPDRMVLLPGGKVLFAELKRPVGGVFEKLQPRWIAKLRALGFTVHVWHTKGSIDAYFEELL